MGLESQVILALHEGDSISIDKTPKMRKFKGQDN